MAFDLFKMNMKIASSFLLIVLIFYRVRKTLTFHAILQHGNFTKVFDYVSSVENFRILNPTIENITMFNKINRTTFKLEYTEHLTQLPQLKNYGRARYRVHLQSDLSSSLHSEHLTCFFTDLFCFETRAKLKIFQCKKLQVGYEETISYSCPWLLTSFCFQEVAHQRHLIISKLRQLFTELN